jgi:AcrR family transcriptional regulator
MDTSRSAAAARPSVVSLRRRGPVLERAILDAALEQLSTVGWNGLTMEGVAAGAQTGKAAVYRRWPSKEDLVAEALRAALPPVGEAPDCGSIREDLYQLGRRLRDAMLSTPGTALLSVLHECDSSASGRFQAVIFQGVIQPSTELFRKVVSRGVERGDVRSDATSELVLDVIPAMMMYRSKVCGSEWPDAYIAELIDQIMVPLLRPSGS